MSVVQIRKPRPREAKNPEVLQPVREMLLGYKLGTVVSVSQDYGRDTVAIPLSLVADGENEAQRS